MTSERQRQLHAGCVTSGLSKNPFKTGGRSWNARLHCQ